MGILLTAALVVILAFAAYRAATHHEAFFTFENTEFVVLLAFLVFVAILLYYRVPGRVAAMLDARADAIRTELAEARALREEAQALVGSFERKRREMEDQAARIVADARAEAERAAAAARVEATRTVERRLASAEERLASAEAKAVGRVRDQAVAAAVAAAQEVLAAQMTPERSGRLIDESIATVGRRLN